MDAPRAELDDLLDVTTWVGVYPPGFTSHSQAPLEISEWLENDEPFYAPGTTPALTQGRRIFTTHGVKARQVLDAYAAGASPRFVDAWLTPSPLQAGRATHADGAWQCATFMHLPEPEAVGWAYTDLLVHNEWAITTWVDSLGPTSYLWVLAGFTLAEAAAMRDGGTVTDQQLRVMVALNGTSLPAGI
ncbi:hypothetical protein [Tessaracoccus sp.]